MVSYCGGNKGEIIRVKSWYKLAGFFSEHQFAFTLVLYEAHRHKSASEIEITDCSTNFEDLIW